MKPGQILTETIDGLLNDIQRQATIFLIDGSARQQFTEEFCVIAPFVMTHVFDWVELELQCGARVT